MLDNAKVSIRLDTCNSFVKKTFHVERKTISQKINELIISKINSEKSDREVAKKTGLSNTAIGNFKNGTSMKLDTLDQIVKAYPELKGEIARYFAEEAEKKESPESEATLKESIKKMSESIASLTQANLVNAQTISQLLSREVVKQG